MTTPRPEIDVLAYSPTANEVLAVECKSFLNSRGVVFQNGEFWKASTYKMFSDAKLRDTILKATKRQLVSRGLCDAETRITLGLATGKIAKSTDRETLRSHFNSHGWRLFDDEWIRKQVRDLADSQYENDVAYMVAKLLHSGKKASS
ncbi:MAG: hypothetical protein R3B90_22145 [Planctomycetaceae bacterium]